MSVTKRQGLIHGCMDPDVIALQWEIISARSAAHLYTARAKESRIVELVLDGHLFAAIGKATMMPPDSVRKIFDKVMRRMRYRHRKKDERRNDDLCLQRVDVKSARERRGVWVRRLSNWLREEIVDPDDQTLVSASREEIARGKKLEQLSWHIGLSNRAIDLIVNWFRPVFWDIRSRGEAATKEHVKKGILGAIKRNKIHLEGIPDCGEITAKEIYEWLGVKIN